MISKIFGKGMKGLDFEQPLSQRNLIVGQNGVGKTARSDALRLALLGYIPGVAKKNNEILDTYGASDVLFVGLELPDKTHLMRRWSRDGKGSVSENFMLDRRKCTRDQYMQAIAGIKVLDLSAFMALSDRKKIDHIFALFPPDGDLGELEEKIAELKEKQGGLQGKIQSLLGTERITGTISRLHSARSAMQLPAGTLAETLTQIQTKEKQLQDARNNLQEARIEKARREAEEATKAQAEANLASERTKMESEAKLKAESEVYAQHQEELREAKEEAPAKTLQTVQHPVLEFVPSPPFDHEASIRSILSAMERTGCGACAAALICKRELAKFRKGVAA
jgi:exonuclease SbcC